VTLSLGLHWKDRSSREEQEPPLECWGSDWHQCQNRLAPPRSRV